MYYPLVATTFAVIAGYLATLVYLTRYLRRVHPATWIALERPLFPILGADPENPWPIVRSAMLTLKFIWNNAHRPLGDKRLDHLIWTIRTLFAAAIILIPLLAMLGS